ncbi:hypothetical protein EZV62_011488 [Acer yangbiense]|uniref:adenylate dimethylallyltransferase (ADP/ATP-dependent) n=1 Tax=Acer yangbiense TaxID=1000413 RepID=A0A5C7I5U8_9ROSI|nr:hypothetical protein EZV62_011488 [Acer yangbiense]
MNSYSVIASRNPNNKKKKVVFIMGATGTGKTKLSIDMATRFSGEIVNSDKIQVYKGLDIATNKATEAERGGVPHYLLGFLEDPEEDFTVQDFCHHALMAISRIIANGHIPIVVGGSNTYIEALIEDPRIKFRANFDCCFIWMDVSLPVLYKHVGKRIDKMVDRGLVEELRGMFVLEKEAVDYTSGIRRAIGAPEMDLYFRVEDRIEDEGIKKLLLNAAIQDMKDNTCKLVNSQLGKIQRLRNQLGWKIHRIDATCVYEEGYDKLEVEDAWKKKVLKPSLGIVVSENATHLLGLFRGKFIELCTVESMQSDICLWAADIYEDVLSNEHARP